MIGVMIDVLQTGIIGILLVLAIILAKAVRRNSDSIDLVVSAHEVTRESLDTLKTWVNSYRRS